MAARRKTDWAYVVAFAVVVAAVVTVLVWVEPEKAEAWLSMAPGIIAAVGMGWGMTRGRAFERDAPPPLAPRPPRRERETDPPPPGE